MLECCIHFLTFSSVLRKNEATAVMPHKAVNMAIGMGSSNWPMMKLKADTNLAPKLHTPSAVAANKVGKK